MKKRYDFILEQKNDFETLVRKWFEQNPHKHRLNPKQVEKVIKKVIEDV